MRSGRPLVPLLLWAGTITPALSPPAMHAQQPTRLTGTVQEVGGGRPVEAATVRLTSSSGLTAEALTDPDGVFSFEAIVPGEYVLLVRRLGYAELSIPLTVEEEQAVELSVRLTPAAIRVAPLEVGIRGRPARLAEAGYYDRMARGWGTFTDPASMTVLRKGSIRLPQLVQILQDRAPIKAAICGRRNTVFLDGRPLDPEFAREMSAWELGAAEVYADGAGLPVFAMTPLTLRCGATLLWSTVTTVGAGNPMPQITVQLCEPVGGPGNVTLEGIVADQVTGVRLPAARVRGSYTIGEGAQRQIDVRTDSLGRYRLCDIPREAEVSLVASYNRITGVPTVVDARPEADAGLKIQVTAPGMIVGDVIHASTGQGLRSVRIMVAGTDHTATSGRSGVFSVGPLPPGSYTIQTLCGGFSLATAQVQVEEGQEARVQLVLKPLGGDRYRCRN